MAEQTEQLNRIFRALPLRGGDEPAKMLEVYFDALDGYPVWALEQAVTRFIRGGVEKQSTQFCPRPPELARVVQSELQPVHDEIHAASKPRKPEFRRSATMPFETLVEKRKQRFAGRPVLQSGVDYNNFRQLCKAKTFPAGASWDWQSQNVYGVPEQ